MPIGFILTDNFDIKPVDYKPHPVMDKYVLLPNGGRKRAALVYHTQQLAVAAARAKLKASQRSINALQAKHDKRLANVEKIDER